MSVNQKIPIFIEWKENFITRIKKQKSPNTNTSIKDTSDALRHRPLGLEAQRAKSKLGV